MVSIDLKDTYFSVPVFQSHRNWNFKRYEFTCLPFGLSLAPRVFTKIFKPIMANFRFLGFRVIIFIDDLILIASSYDECLQQLDVLKQTLCELGFTVNVEKSQLVPVNEILYLGFIEKIVSACKALLAKHQPSVRDVAKITGLLVSALPAVNYLEMHYRSLELCKTQTLSASFDYDKTLCLSSQARSDLQWVIENIAQCNGRLFQAPNIDIYIQSDASLIGWGAVSGSLSASGRCSQSESEHHINYLELLASFHALQWFVSNSRSIHDRLAVDNSTAVAYINNMGVHDPPY